MTVRAKLSIHLGVIAYVLGLQQRHPTVIYFREKFHPRSLTGSQKTPLYSIVESQLTFSCSKSTIETVEEVSNIFKVSNKNTRLKPEIYTN